MVARVALAVVLVLFLTTSGEVQDSPPKPHESEKDLSTREREAIASTQRVASNAVAAMERLNAALSALLPTPTPDPMRLAPFAVRRKPTPRR